MENPINSITISTETEFLETLRLSNPVWNLSIPGDTNWINREVWGFRGQSDADWTLVPSAFRKNVTLGFKPASKPPTLTPQDQQNEERRTLNDFLFFADRIGLDVAGDGPIFRFPRLPGHPPKLDLSAWPWDMSLETLAIAQHHGVPTRLLDFTYDSLVAAFFACYDAWEKLGRPSYKDQNITVEKMLAVWAVHLPLIYKSVAEYSRSNRNSRIILVTAPRSRNSYLHNQEGFFLIDLMADKEKYPSLEKAIIDVRSEMIASGLTQLSSPQIIKIQFPWKRVPRMLALLWNEFYNIARMQPSLDKAVQALKDHRDLFS